MPERIHEGGCFEGSIFEECLEGSFHHVRSEVVPVNFRVPKNISMKWHIRKLRLTSTVTLTSEWSEVHTGGNISADHFQSRLKGRGLGRLRDVLGNMNGLINNLFVSNGGFLAIPASFIGFV